MDIIALFKDFGFPALITGVLLWMYATKLEKLVASNEALKDAITRLENKMDDICDEVKSVKENTKPRPRGGTRS